MRAVYLGSLNITANLASYSGALDTKNLSKLQGPWKFHFTTADIGTAPTGTIAIDAKVQEAPDSDETFVDAGIAMTQVTAAGGSQESVVHSTADQPLLPWVKVVVQASATAWNAGTKLEVWAVGAETNA